MEKVYNFIRCATLVMLSIAFVQCDDFLDMKDRTQKSEQNFPLTENDAQQALAGCYHIMHENQVASFMGPTIFSDEMFGGDVPGSSPEMLYEENLNDYTIEMFSNRWPRLYKGVYRCNKLIEAIDQISFKSETTKKQVLGEAHFMRGMYYFDLTRMYGDVPLYPTSDVSNIPRTSAAEVFALIGSDMKKAIELLPATPFASILKSDLGHASKWAAEAMMARVFLFYTGYYKSETLPLFEGGNVGKDEVISYLNDCIQNSGHGLVRDFRELWPYTNEYTGEDYAYNKGKNLKWIGETGENKETVFAIQFGINGNWGLNYHNDVCVFYGFPDVADEAAIFPFGKGWGCGFVNPRIVEQWMRDEPDDVIRRSGTVFNVNDPAEGIVNPEQTIVSTKMLMTGWWQKKYVPINVWKNKEAKTYSLYSVFTDNANDDYVFANTQDLVLIRFADVLLMHSELTQTPDGMNTVRKRAGLKPLPAYSLEALQRERLYELFAESSRYYNLLRWYGKEAGAVIDRNQNGVEVWNCGTKDKINFNLTERIRATGGFLQISQKEINLSGGVLTQTPGWQ